MISALLRRALSGAAVVAGVVTLTFVLLRLAPGDPVERLLGPAATTAQVAVQRHELGLDRPLAAQYVGWVKRFAAGDWGTSIATGRPVRQMIARAWPATALLVLASLALSYLIGISVGIVQAARSGTPLDTGLSVLTVTLFAIPGYWLGLMLVMLFTYHLRLLPAFGAAGLDADFLPPGAWLVDRLRHLALPLATLTLVGIGGTARFVRGAMLDVRAEPFVLTARAKGVGRIRVLIRHVFRNALVPVLTLLGLSLPAVFSGTVFIEAIFAWPGVGRVLVNGVIARGLSGGDGGDRDQRGAGSGREHSGRTAGGLGGPARAGSGGFGGGRMTATARLWRDPRGIFGLVLLGVAAAAAIAAPLVTGGHPAAQGDVVATRFLTPLSHGPDGIFHLLGTDRFGRDLWTRLVYGARISLTVGALATAISVGLGVLIGAAAGVWRGAVGGVLLALTDFALALPRVVLLLLLAALWQPSAVLVIVVLGLTGWMTIARLVYGETRSLVARPFVESARALGARRGRLLVRHVLPNTLTPVIVAAALGFGNAILLEAGLSFLGLGVQPPTPSWGNMIASGRDTLVNAPWVATAPGVALVLVVLACTLLGDALRDALDPARIG